MTNAGRRRHGPFYFTPYQRIARSSPGHVLIVGAGSGSDVAIALEAGASHVDAVEIDPELYRFGVQRHPERPYADPRVEVFITDGRAFLESTDRRYDQILFALPDSLTLVGGQSALAARKLPVHARGVRGGASTAESRRCLRDLQLLSRAVAGRPAGGDAARRVWRSAMSRQLWCRGYQRLFGDGRGAERTGDQVCADMVCRRQSCRARPLTITHSSICATERCRFATPSPWS